MTRLAISSSTQRASLALQTPNGLFSLANHRPQSHSEFLNAGLAHLFERTETSPADLKTIAVDRGPGSFTGVRAAVNLARALGYALGKPLIAKTSLEILAIGAPQNSVTAINAHKNLLFVRWGDTATIELLSLPDFSSAVQRRGCPLFAIGEGFLQYAAFFPTEVQHLLIRTDAFPDFPNAEKLLPFAECSPEIFDWKSVQPLYVRASSAEEVLSEKQGKGSSDVTSGLGHQRG